ncbi:hypothetical protein Syun_029081 [Stephania yunnanensis]|uniref:Xylanase inhibitor C-terminal domain-containing protein n=1 Tax=Stephania yunnanensis TaxID=152371 RepID=A0AAP0E9A2_9MAGN
MVEVGEDALCLGMVDGGDRSTRFKTSIVISGNQLEDNLLEFDLTRSRLGVVDEPKTPELSMVFDSPEDVKKSFQEYANRYGFGVKVRSTDKKDGVVWKEQCIKGA